MNAQAIYETFQGFEEQVASVYFTMSRQFASHTRLSWFWAEMTFEELQHGSTLRFCRESALFSVEEVSEESIARIRALLERAATVAADKELTVTEAFRLAFEIESSEIDDIYEKLTRPLYSPYPFLQEAFHLGYRDHLRRFAKAIVQFSGDASLNQNFESLARKHTYSNSRTGTE